MIYGIGTDIVSIKRIEAALTKHGETFKARILHDAEIVEIEQHLEKTLLLKQGMRSMRDIALSRFVAKRWAAKEAFAKAFGTGIGEAVSFHDVMVSHDKRGKPIFLLSDPLRDRMAQAHAGAQHLTISDEAEYAVAFVVIECATANATDVIKQ